MNPQDVAWNHKMPYISQIFKSSKIINMSLEPDIAFKKISHKFFLQCITSNILWIKIPTNNNKLNINFCYIFGMH